MHSASVFNGFLRRWRLSVLGLMLSFLHLTAHADLWAYVDAQGVTHFAASQTDERYQLYFKGTDAGKLDMTAGEGAAKLAPPKDSRLGLKAGKKGGEPKFEMPKRFANLDTTHSYKAVHKHLLAAAKTHKVDYELLKAVIAAESGFDPVVVSPKGAVGLMQLLPTTAEQYGVLADKEGRKDRKGNVLPTRSVEEKLTDPQTNINAGARYLAYLIKLFKGELELAVAAYNAGEGAVQRAGNKIPKFKETQGYVKTVMGLYGVFKPEQTVVADARATAAAPVAKAVGRVGSGRVRVELAGSSQNAEPAKSSASALAVDAAASALTPVLYTVPALGADVRVSSAASGS
jgi:hypothetical protein